MSPKIQTLILFSLCLFVFGVYASTAARTVSWAHLANSGPQLLTQIYTQPLTWSPKLPYLATAKILKGLTSRFNIIDSAFPFNLLSAFWASLTVGIIYLIILSLAPTLQKPAHLSKPPNLIWLPSVFGSLALAVSLTFWSQALVTQTTTFNFFFFSLIVLLFLKTIQLGKKKTPILIFGLLFSTLILVLNNPPSINLPFHFRTLKQILANLETIFFLITANFRTPSLVLALIGLVFGLERTKPRLPLLFLFFGQICFDSLFLTTTSPAFFFPSFLTIVLFAGLGFKVLLEIILAVSLSDLAVSFENRLFLLIFKLKKAGQVLKYVGFCFLGYLVLTTLLFGFETTRRLVDLKNESEAYRFGQSAIAVLPQQAMVFCEDEKFLFTLDYFSKVINPNQKFEIFLFDRTTRKTIEANIQRRPIFFALVESPVSPGKTVGKWEGYTLISRGPLYQVQKPNLVQ